MAKTSLEKSHSKTSNFKLTMICALLSISFSLIWVGLIFIEKNKPLGISISAASAVVALFSFFLIGRFTR
ncbi:MAG: hypothetical protein J5936_01120 [Acholeplasmatales bacterium]|nr:hypothetical protein [Acholeplasmatales bacterium]